MKLRTSVLAGLILCMLVVAGCSKSAADVIDLGKTEDNTYANTYFGFSVDVPQDWVLLTREEIDLVSGYGEEILVGENSELAKEIEAARDKIANMLFVFKYPLSYDHRFNPSFMCIGDKLTFQNSLRVKSGEEALGDIKKGLQHTGIPYTFGKITATTLGGKDFHVLTAKITGPDISITQKYYCTIMKGYVVSVLITYSSEAELAELQNILDSIEFN